MISVGVQDGEIGSSFKIVTSSLLTNHVFTTVPGTLLKLVMTVNFKEGGEVVIHWVKRTTHANHGDFTKIRFPEIQ